MHNGCLYLLLSLYGHRNSKVVERGAKMLEGMFQKVGNLVTKWGYRHKMDENSSKKTFCINALLPTYE